jgi:protein SCO1
MDTKRRIAGAVVLGLALWAPAIWSHEGHAQHDAGTAASASQGRAVKVGDVALLDQDGRRLRLASDAIGDKVVVVTFVFTNCVDTCPLVSHTFSQVQEQLGALMEQRVRLISLTIDPVRDTPARLKAYAAQHGAGPGWLWLTGDPRSVTTALEGFGVHNASPDRHPSLVLVGDLRSGRWTPIYDIDNAQQLVANVADHLAARHAGADIPSYECPRGKRLAAPGTKKADCVAQPA